MRRSIERSRSNWLCKRRQQACFRSHDRGRKKFRLGPTILHSEGPGALENQASSRLKAKAASFGNCAGRSSVLRLQGAIDIECSASCNKRRWQREYAMVCRITNDVINALQHCRLKAYFQLNGEAGGPMRLREVGDRATRQRAAQGNRKDPARI